VAERAEIELQVVQSTDFTRFAALEDEFALIFVGIYVLALRSENDADGTYFMMRLN
jgi:hypothetical protein